MKDISFDNPYLLLIAIPLLLIIILPFFIIGNKDNRNLSWKISIGLHVAIVVMVTLAVAGLKATSVLTKTTVYVVADVSYSSERNLDEIDAYVEQIKEELPKNAKMGVVCFGKNVILHTPVGKALRSVSEANVDDSATDIVAALNYTETLFKGDTLKRIVLITDGNDTANASVGSVAAAVNRLTENGIKIDTVFLNNNLKEGELEVQLTDAEYASSTYLDHENEVEFLLQASGNINVVVELYAREQAADGQPEAEFEKIDYTVLTVNQGTNSVSMSLPSTAEGTFEYMAKAVTDDDISAYNNSITFMQEIVGRTKILLITGKSEDESIVREMYGEQADIDCYLVVGERSDAPFMLEQIIEYDEIVISNVDIRNIKNVNAMIDSLDMAIAQYGKSLITFGDLRLQTDQEDIIFNKFQELLPVDYGNSKREGRLYTIVLDVSHSMFMASKFTTAKQAAINLLSVLGDDDYVGLITFSGEIKVVKPQKAKICRQELIQHIDSYVSEHGTDIGLGLQEALKTIEALKLEENQIMLISDGISADAEKDAKAAKKLFDYGATVSAICTYGAGDAADGKNNLQNIVNTGTGGNYYEINRPEDVEGVVFGSIADDIGEVVIEKDAKANIIKYNDPIARDFTELPMVSGYIISRETYDASVPMTVTHLKAAGYTETVPLYAYRSHGNGRVASFTSNLSGDWTKHWSTEDKQLFVNNMFVSNTPKTRKEAPVSVNIERTEQETYIEIVPSILDPDAQATLKITLPNGRKTTKELAFDGKKFFYTLETVSEGLYKIDITYVYEDKTYVINESFEIPYLAEYNAFAGCDTSKIYQFMRGKGTITEGDVPDLENDKKEVSTYQESYVIPLLIAAIAVFVADILIRKLSLNKIKKQKKQKR